MTCQRSRQVLPAWKSLLGLLAAFVMYWLLPATPVLADAATCPGGLTVEGSALETEIACARYRVVQAYFGAIGYDGHPKARVRFEETVHVDDVPNGYEVTGQFLADRHLIEMTSLDSRSPARLLHWGQPWSADMAASILDHELVHLYVDALRTAPLPHAWNEFVAYAVQFELMDPELRRTILSAYPDAAPYSDPSAVCDIGYLLDFDLFGLRAYLTAEAHGGPAYLAGIVSGAAASGTPRRYECP